MKKAVIIVSIFSSGFSWAQTTLTGEFGEKLLFKEENHLIIESNVVVCGEEIVKADPADSSFVKITGGKCSYDLRISKIASETSRKIHINVFKNVNGKLILLVKKEFISYGEYVLVAGAGDLYSDSEISLKKSDLDKVIIKAAFKGKDILPFQLTVYSFRLTFTTKGNTYTFDGKGNVLSKEMKEKMKKLSSGDTVYLTSITAKAENGYEYRVNSMLINIL